MRATILRADVLDGLGSLGPDCFDACLTDPPYGLSFMGKQWDHGVPSAEVWAEVLRVLKPGAMLLAFGGTRTHHRLMVAIEDAGFEIRDCLMYLYGSGFPKSLDISKGIDKAAGVEREVVGQKPSSLGGTVAAGERDPDYISKHRGLSFDVTAPATPEAVRWSGYGTALKPAWEIVILAMKPLDGTFAGNAVKHGVAGLNVDGGRVGTGDSRETTTGGMGRKSAPVYGEFARDSSETYTTTQGRWPANVLLDEDAAAMLDREAGWSKDGTHVGRNRKGEKPASVYGKFQADGKDLGYGSSGGPSRFFYTAKASSAERNAGLAGMPERRNHRYSERGQGPLEQQTPAIGTLESNHHPTVKPVDLAAYLARLILPPERDNEPRRLLVPFCGSGSEIIGAARAGWEEAVGIELESEYVALAQRRIEADAPLFSRCEVVTP